MEDSALHSLLHSPFAAKYKHALKQISSTIFGNRQAIWTRLWHVKFSASSAGMVSGGLTSVPPG